MQLYDSLPTRLGRCALLTLSLLAGSKLGAAETSVGTVADRPGNVFLSGEPVSVVRPEATVQATSWTASDESGRQIAAGMLTSDGSEKVTLGTLPVGWYRVSLRDAAGTEVYWTAAAVLAPLAEPRPQHSPICVDSATAWFAANDPARQEALSILAARAGVSWIRDRLRWRDIEPGEGKFTQDTTYDSSAVIAHRHGLQVLQVFHDTPPWAAADGRERGRFPVDLRHVYRFARAMSKRFGSFVSAWEPWNEANVATFGGHTMDEICSFQKAAYLGFKAGDPQVTVCWNATTGVPTLRQTEAVLDNETWSYFDTYNIHTYDWSHAYDRLWAPARQAACGKPLWITESDRGMKYEADSPMHDLSAINDRLKAQYVTQSYATSLSVGAQQHFHFILGEYSEGPTQFGLLRQDLTPRPGYVALAALGRFLAGAHSLGRLADDDHPDRHVYAFRAQPDGQVRDVLVAWIEREVDWDDRGKTTLSWQLPTGLHPEACYDYLGRETATTFPCRLTSAPLFILLPEGECDHLSLTQPSAVEPRAEFRSPVVLQCVMPRRSSQKMDRVPWAWEIEHTVSGETPTDITICAYNFADHEVQGKIAIEQLPVGSEFQPASWEIQLQPMQRQELPLRVRLSGPLIGSDEGVVVKLRGDFAADGAPVLAFRLISVHDDKSSDPTK